MVVDSAESKTFCNATARGPGADATGAWGGGDGDAELRGSMSLLCTMEADQESCVDAEANLSLLLSVQGCRSTATLQMQCHAIYEYE